MIAPVAGQEVDALSSLPLKQLVRRSEALTLAGHGTLVTISRKGFIPLTKLCRDVCHYYTFARAPKALEAAYLSAQEVLAIARVRRGGGMQKRFSRWETGRGRATSRRAMP